MSEEMRYLLVCDIFFIGNCLVAAACLTRLCRAFSKRKKGMWLTGGAYFLAVLGLYYMPWIIDNFAAYFLALLAAFAVFFYLDRRDGKTKIFLFATFFVLRWIVFSMTNRIGSFACQTVCRLLGNGSYLFFFIAFTVECVLELAANLALLGWMVKKINESFAIRTQEMKLQELVSLLIPSVGGMLCYRIFRIYDDVFERETSLSIFDAHPQAEFLWVLYHIITLAAIMSAIISCQEMRKRQEEENARLMLEQSMQGMQSHIREVERLYAKMRGIRHDIRNHVSVLAGLLEQGKTREAEEYLKPLGDAAEFPEFSARTGNPITDVIIQEKMAEASGQGIKFQSDFHYPEGGGFHAFDLSIILTNALSNALEAASGGFVRISSFQNKNTYLITVENSFRGRLVLDGESKVPKSTKADEKAHGFGLQNIKMVAEKYLGDVLLEQEEEKVTLTVMLSALKISKNQGGKDDAY